LTRRLIMDLVFIVIFDTEYSTAFGWNPALTSCSVTLVTRCPPAPLSVTDLAPSHESGSRLEWEAQYHGSNPLIPNFEQR